jgi:3-methyladenine DNA glycosylase AlkD
MKYIQEVESALKKIAKGIDPEKARYNQHYAGSSWPHLGLTVPQQRALFKEGYSFSKLPWKEQFPIWEEIWKKGKFFEIRMQALYFVTGEKSEDVLKLWKLTKNWVDEVENWPSSDTLSSLYSRCLEAIPDDVFPVYRKWNKSSYSWKRRQSIVGLLYYRSLRKKVLPFSKLIPLVQNLIQDSDVFVQKGVGWTLREIYQVYPDPTLDFIESNVHRLTSIAFASSTEKVSSLVKERLKKQRKFLRSGLRL